MTEYGLAGLRDKDGELQTVEYSFEWSGQEITLKIRPPTLSEQQALEDLGDDASADELQTILDRHIVKPDVAGDYTTREMWAYVEGLMRFSMGEDNDLADQVANELDARQSDSEGN